MQFKVQVRAAGSIPFTDGSARTATGQVNRRYGATVDEMSSRERILAALNGQAVDRLPFVPLIDTYSLLDMPVHVQQALQPGDNEVYWRGILAAMRAIGCDILLRHVNVSRSAGGAMHLNGFGQFR